MTRRLILIRHAKSDWNHPGLSDHERPLNGRGAASALAVGDWLRAQRYIPDQVLSSSAMRTRETYQLMRLATLAQFHDTLYLASAETMLNALQQATGDTVVLLGHNPGIGDLARRLVGSPPSHPRFFDYPTCATLVADFAVDNWAQVEFGTAQTVDFIIPRELS